MADLDASSEPDITEEELRKETNNILKNANLANTSTKIVVQKLEKKFGTNLSSKKKLIDRLVMDYVNSLESSDDEEEKADSDKEDASDSEKEEKKKPSPKKIEESDEESGGAKTRGRKAKDKKKKTPAKGKKAGGVTKRGGKGGGYTRAIKLSPELSELVGATELPRHEVVKRVWAIIKERQLIDPNNRQFAICDKPLYKVIGTQRFYTFGMMKYLKNHFLDG